MTTVVDIDGLGGDDWLRDLNSFAASENPLGGLTAEEKAFADDVYARHALVKVATLTKAEVNYRMGDAEQHCGNCVMFHGNGTCDLVEGVITPGSVCDRWEARPAEKRGGNAQTLRDYWSGHGHAGPSHGAERDAIAWGTPGDFDRCVAMVTTHGKMTPEQAKGYCNLRHHDALGYWPTQHARMERGKGAEPDAEKGARPAPAFIMARAPNENGKWRYLLQQRASGEWGLPGGHAEKGEDPWDAATRETAEETGGTLGDLPAPSVVMDREDNGAPVRTFLVHLPAVTAVGADGSEATAHAWFRRKDVDDLPLHPAMERAWKDAGDKGVLDTDPPASVPVLKFGAEGYVHGWVCVRPPCGAVGDNISHHKHGNGVITSRDGEGVLRARFDDGTEGKLGKPDVVSWGFNPWHTGHRRVNPMIGSVQPDPAVWAHAQRVAGALRHATWASSHGRRDVASELSHAASALRTETPQGYLAAAGHMEEAARMARAPHPPGLADDVAARARLYVNMAAEFRRAAPGVTPGALKAWDSSRRDAAGKNSPYNASDGQRHALALPGVVKVGPEGYIHGWICIRPPCSHDFRVRVTRNDVGDYEVHHRATGNFIGTIRREGGKWRAVTPGGEAGTLMPSRARAMRQLAQYHNAMMLNARQNEIGFRAANHVHAAGTLILGGEKLAASGRLLSAIREMHLARDKGEITTQDHDHMAMHLDDLYRDIVGGHRLLPLGGGDPSHDIGGTRQPGPLRMGGERVRGVNVPGRHVPGGARPADEGSLAWAAPASPPFRANPPRPRAQPRPRPVVNQLANLGKVPAPAPTPSKAPLAEFDNDAQKKLRADVASGLVEVGRPDGQGAQAKTDVVTTKAGTRVIRKQFIGYLGDPSMADRELLSSKVGEAVGVGHVPAVVKTKDGEVFMELVPGKTAGRSSYEALDEADGHPDAVRIGVMDVLTDNDDRHNSNWMITPRTHEPVPIDNSSTFGASGGGMHHFALMADKVTPAELAEMKPRLEALQPEFAAAGRAGWHAEMMARFTHLEARAERFAKVTA